MNAAPHPDYTRVIISPTHTHTHKRTGEVGVAFLSFVLGGKGNLSGKDCVEQEALVVRELFLSLNEHGRSSQSRGFN